MSARRVKTGRILIGAPPLLVSSFCFATAPTFSAGTETGIIANASVTEASGIVASRLNPNVLWTHNDSGHPPQIFPLTSAGTNLGTYTVGGVPGVTVGNTDWEDISLGPGPVAGVPYLYCGDIGDNNNNRASIAIYRLPEPVVSDTQAAQSVTLSGSISGAVKFSFVYPDGLGHNAESMFVDPLTKDIYIVTKHINPSVYVAPYPQSTSGTTTLTLVASFTDPDPPTGADISSDGSEILLRGYSTNSYSGLTFFRPSGGTVADAFNTTPISIPMHAETQGEAIGFDPNNSGYFTTSDGGGSQPVYYMTRTSGPPATLYWDNDGAPAGTYNATGAGMGGTGTWNSTAAKWYTGGAEVAFAGGTNAVFWGTAGTITLSAAQTVSSLAFKSDGYVLSGSTITLAGPDITVDAGVTTSIGSKISGTSGLTKNGAGTLNLATSNNYTGGTIINGGVLSTVSSSLGTNPTAPTTNLTINNGSTLRFNLNGLTLAINRQIVLGLGGGTFDTNGNDNSIAGVITGASMTKTGAGTLVLSNSNTISGTLGIIGGTLSITGNTTVGNINQSAGSLSVNGYLHVAANNQSPLSTSILSAAPSITSGAQLDLEDNALIVNYGAETTGATRDAIRNLLINGRNAGPGAAAPWNGLGGITSSFVHANGNGFNLAIGYADNAALAGVGAGSYTSFGGQAVASNTILVQMTYGADANLDGKVDGQDVSIIGTHFNKPDSGQWYFGDFDYSGLCDGNDVSVLGTTFGKTSPALSPAMLSAEFGSAFAAALDAGQIGMPVPEPADLTLIGLCGAAAMAKRRRRGVQLAPSHGEKPGF